MLTRPAKCPDLTISIDPGVRYAGVALFQGAVLLQGCKVKSPKDLLALKDTGHNATLLANTVRDWVVEKLQNIDASETHVVVEGQQTRTYGKGDPQVLVQLALTSGILLGKLSALRCVTQTVYVPPTSWKGSLEKSMMLNRIRNNLSPAELLRTKTDKDTLDAVGIGLWYLKRI